MSEAAVCYKQVVLPVEVWLRLDNAEGYINFVRDYNYEVQVKSLTPGVEVISSKVSES